MDEHGIDMQVVSCSTQAQLTPPDQAVPFTRAANDRLAEATARGPGRLSGAAVLPWPDPLNAGKLFRL